MISVAPGRESPGLGDPARRPLLARLVPVSERLRGYGGGTLRSQAVLLGYLHGVAVGAVSLAVLRVLRWRLRRFPGPLVVVVAAVVASAALDLAADGVAVVGDIRSGLPAVKLPDADWATAWPCSRRPWGTSSSATPTRS